MAYSLADYTRERAICSAAETYARETMAKRGNQYGEKQRYGRALIGGKLYRWQGQGAGMYARFRAIKGA